VPGDASQAGPWIDHIAKVYGDYAEHIQRYLAHRVQKPQEKINHALVLGGSQGIGKDTLLEPVKTAIGHWNFADVSPRHVLGCRFATATLRMGFGKSGNAAKQSTPKPSFHPMSNAWQSKINTASRSSQWSQ